MDQAEIIDFTREAIMLTITISTPVLVVGLLVGVVISLVQALTQVQEMTLAFVPKIIAIFATIFLLFPTMIITMTAFMNRITDTIAGMGG